MLFPIIYLNGQFVPKHEAMIPVWDLGLLRGLGIFDFLRVEQGIPLFVEDHLDRLQQSMGQLQFGLQRTEHEWKSLIRELIRINEADRAGFRIVVTGGYSEDGYTVPEDKNVYMMLHQLPQRLQDPYTEGVRILTAAYHRDMPEIKTTIYVKSLSMQQELLRAKAYEVLYHWDGEIFECSRCNIFFIDQDGALHTPSRGILKGVTRKQVMSLAAAHGIPVYERQVRMEELPDMAGAFLTATTKGVLPVRQIDDMPVGNGAVHPLAQQLNQLYDERVVAYMEAAR